MIFYGKSYIEKEVPAKLRPMIVKGIRLADGQHQHIIIVRQVDRIIHVMLSALKCCLL